jgi:hypothetical protein
VANPAVRMPLISSMMADLIGNMNDLDGTRRPRRLRNRETQKIGLGILEKFLNLCKNMTGKDLQELVERVGIVDVARFNSLDIVHGKTQALVFMVVKRRDVDGASRYGADVEGRGEGTGGWSDGNRLGSCCGGAGGGGGGGMSGLLMDCNTVPDGVVTVMTSDDCAS